MAPIVITEGDAVVSEIYIERGILTRAGSLMPPNPERRRVVVLTQPTVTGPVEQVERSLSDAGNQVTVITLPDGDAAKSLSVVESVVRDLNDLTLGRADMAARGLEVVPSIADTILVEAFDQRDPAACACQQILPAWPEKLALQEVTAPHALRTSKLAWSDLFLYIVIALIPEESEALALTVMVPPPAGQERGSIVIVGGVVSAAGQVTVVPLIAKLPLLSLA